MSISQTVVELDLEAATQLIDRVASALPEDARQDKEQLRAFLSVVVSIVRLVRERGTTIKRLRRLFGLAKSERIADVLAGRDPARAPAQDAKASTPSNDEEHHAGTAADPSAEASSDKSSAEEQKKKGHGRTPRSAYVNATEIFVPHQSLTPGCECPGGCGGKVREQKDPAVTIRIKGRAPLEASCWACQRLRCDTCGDVFTAQKPAEAQGPKADASAASIIGVLHYGAGMPFNRLDHVQRALGAPVPASTQWEIVRDRVWAFYPVYSEFLRQAAQGSLLYTDDTYARVTELMGRRREELIEQDDLIDPERTGIFTTGLVSKVDEHRMICLFSTGRRHAGENLDDLLDLRPAELPDPQHMSDGLSRNAPKRHRVQARGCLSHGRRAIVDQVDNFPDECSTLLELFCAVFKNDADAREQKLSDEERLRLHQKKSGPVLGKIKKTINTLLRERRVEENSDLGKALLYLRKQWRKMTLFLRVAGAPITNNLCERILKMAILYRKNSYFYRSTRGAMVGDIYMSLIHTATLCRENPFDYLTALQVHEAQVAERPAEWMPWNFRATIAGLMERPAQAA